MEEEKKAGSRNAPGARELKGRPFPRTHEMKLDYDMMVLMHYGVKTYDYRLAKRQLKECTRVAVGDYIRFDSLQDTALPSYLMRGVSLVLGPFGSADELPYDGTDTRDRIPYSDGKIAKHGLIAIRLVTYEESLQMVRRSICVECVDCTGNSVSLAAVRPHDYEYFRLMIANDDRFLPAGSKRDTRPKGFTTNPKMLRGLEKTRQYDAVWSSYSGEMTFTEVPMVGYGAEGGSL